MQSQCTQQFYQDPISLQKAADYTGFTTDELILKAAIGKLPVCFHYYGFVGLFRATAKDGPIVRFSPHTPNDDDDTLPPHPGDFFIVSGVFRSFKQPVILCRHPAEVWFCPAAIEAITISSEFEQPPVVPDGFALGRVDAASRCLDDSQVSIDDWLFLPEDLDRLTKDAAEQPAAEQPAVEQPATPDSLTVNDAPEGKPADGEGQAEIGPPTEHNPIPVQRQQFQEREILRVISELGHKADALPKPIPSKPGAKAAVRGKLPTLSPKVFDLAWERLRKDRRIQYAE